MPTPLAVFTADNHLRPTTWSKHPELREDSYVSFRQIVDFAVKRSLPLILLGDLFNQARPDALSVQVFFQEMDKMDAAKLPVVYIEGNHDREPPNPSWASLHPLIGEERYRSRVGEYIFLPTCPNEPIGAIHYTAAGGLPEAVQKVSDTRIWLAHQAWIELMGIGGSTSLNVFPHGGTLLTGDYHVTLQHSHTLPSGELLEVWSPGSTSMQSLSEAPSKHFGVLSLEDDCKVSVVWSDLATRPYVRRQVASPAQLEQLLIQVDHLARTASEKPALAPEIQKPILHVKFEATLPEAEARIMSAAAGQFHVFPEPQYSKTAVQVDVSQVHEGQTPGLREAVKTLAPEDPAVVELAIRLLESQTPQGELTAAYAEYNSPQP